MKRKHLGFFLLLAAVMAISAFILALYDREDRQTYVARSGEMDLQDWNHEKYKTLELSGDWNFYPKSLKADINSQSLPGLKKVPHWWEEDEELEYSPYGYATYILTVRGLCPGRSYAIDVVDTVTAYALYINDKKIAFNGVVGRNKESSTPHWRHETAVFLADQGGNAKIVFEISNYDYYRGGMWNTPMIGYAEDVFQAVQKQDVIEMFLFAAIMSCAFFHIGLYIVYRKDQTTLYFALFCTATATQTILTGQRVINFFLPVYDWNVMVRLEYLSGYLMLPFFVLFFVHCVLDKTEMIWLKRIFLGFILGCVVIILIPGHIYSSFLIIYKWMSFFMALCLSYIVYQAVRKKHGDYECMLLSMEVMILAILKENIIGGNTSWVPYATLVFIFAFSYLSLKHFMKLIKEKEDLEAKILVDPLTGLYNRKYLKEIEFNQIVAPGNCRKYFLFLDLDDFKEVNDTYGHKIGDYILRETGSRFHKILESHDIICRYGGDEFICIVMAESLEQVEETAKKIIQEIQEPFVKNNGVYQVGISIGICPESDERHTLGEYIKYSDEAMYQAKKNGKNGYMIWDWNEKAR